MKADVGIIGGTGVGERLIELGGRPIHVPTEFGLLRGRLLDIDGLSVCLIQRHSAGHKTPPHLVNYRAMATGLKALGAKYCLSTAAVGSLREEWDLGTFCVCADYLDATGRNLTLFDRSVRHTDFSAATKTQDALTKSALASGSPFGGPAVYVCTNGPRFETPFEVQTYARLGGDLVGMTAASEAIAMRETEIDYGCLAIVTNLAAGISKTPIAHGDVSREMRKSAEDAVKILLSAAKSLA